MSSAKPPILEDIRLDILGQQERINRLYTQITLCFPLPDDSESTHAGVIETLDQGLSRLSKTFPWTAGEVVGGGPGPPGGFTIRASSENSPSRLVIKDQRNDATIATWGDLKESAFPFSMLDEDVIAPCKTMVESGAKRPVLLLQANFIQGGLLLTVSAQHGSMDVAGQGQVIGLLAKAMRGEVFSQQEIDGGNTSRKGRIPLLEDVQLSETAAVQEEKDTAEGGHAEGEPPSSQQGRLTWAYLAFTQHNLTCGIKKCALEEIPGRSFVSTDDTLTAFMWQAISRAREPRLLNASAKTTLTRNVDVRQHFDLPPSYPGLFVTATSHTSPVTELVHRRSLGSVALELRSALEPEALRGSLRSQATSIVRDCRGVNGKSASRRASPNLDVKLSSWAKERQLYDLDFGLFLGKPEAIRRPAFLNGAREGLVYFLPTAPDGEVVVGLCLVEEDMQRLRDSAKIASWAKWIG